MAKNLGNLFIDGENGFTDTTGTHTLINTGTTITSTDSKFGTNSLLAISDDSITAPRDIDFDFGVGDFTVDFWAKNISGTYGAVVQLGRSAFGSMVGALPGNGTLACWLGDGGSWGVAEGASMGLLPGEAWTHYAVVRSGNTFRAWRNGVKQTEWTASGSVSSLSGDLVMFKYLATDGATSFWASGGLDNFRLVKGTALWTEPFALDAASLLYDLGFNISASTLYNMSSSKGNLRGKAKEGFIRPTIGQFFTSMDFEEIEPIVFNLVDYTADLCPTGGGTITSNGGFNDTKAFNGVLTGSWNLECWYFGSSPGEDKWIQYQFIEPKRIRQVALSSLSNQGGVEWWGTFVLKGSMNGVDFTQLALGTNTGSTYDRQAFQFENDGSYTYYRVEITSWLPNSVGGDGAHIHAIEMMEGIYE